MKVCVLYFILVLAVSNLKGAGGQLKGSFANYYYLKLHFFLFIEDSKIEDFGPDFDPKNRGLRL